MERECEQGCERSKKKTKYVVQLKKIHMVHACTESRMKEEKKPSCINWWSACTGEQMKKSKRRERQKKYLSANTYVYCIRYELVVTFVKIHTNDI